jgi:hypothetical protein
MAVDVCKPRQKFVPHLLAARDQDLNEADIVVRLVKVFEDVLGYDTSPCNHPRDESARTSTSISPYPD